MAYANDDVSSTINKTCDIHPQEEYQRYCQNCDVLVCVECIIGQHKHHNCVKMFEILDLKRKEITQYIKDLKRKQLMHLNERLTSIKLNQESYSSESAAVKSAITEKAEKLKTEVDVIRDELIKFVNEKEKADKMYLRKLAEKIEKEVLEFETFIQNCDQQVKVLRGTEVIEFVKECKHALLKLSQMSKSQNINPPTYIDKEINVQSIRDMFGCLSTKEEGSGRSKSKGNTSPRNSISEKFKLLMLGHSHKCLKETKREPTQQQDQRKKPSGNSERVSYSTALSTRGLIAEPEDEMMSDYELSSDSADIEIMAPRKDISVVSCFRSEKKPTALAALGNTELWVSNYDGDLTKLKNNGLPTAFFKPDFHFCINALVVSASGDLLINNASDRKISKLSKTGRIIDFVDTAPFTPEGICITENDDFLVTLYRFDCSSSKSEGKVVRYSPKGLRKLSIQCDDKGREFFKNPCFIAENSNGDVWVTDLQTDNVVVVNQQGKFRFEYNGAAMGANFTPRGIICNDQGQALIVDNQNDSVHLVDKDGQFLGLVLTKQDGLRRPYSLIKDQSGNFYLGNVGNNLVIVFSFTNPTRLA